MGRRLANKMKYQQQWSDSSEKKKNNTDKSVQNVSFIISCHVLRRRS